MRRMAAEDKNLQAMLLGALVAGGVVPSVANTGDIYFDGQTSGGEILLNSLITALPLATTAGGGLAAMMADPVLAEQVLNAMRDVPDIGNPLRTVVNQAKADDPASNQKLMAAAQKMAADEMKAQKMITPDDERMKKVLQRSFRRGGGAALGGALVGGIPAVLMMQDAPAES